MSRVTSGIIGFMGGAGLALLGVVIALSDVGADDVLQYGLLFFGLPVGLFGGLIGAAIGIVIGQKVDESSPYPDYHSCPSCGCRVPDVYRTCRQCGAKQE